MSKAENTRLSILEKAFEIVYSVGYQSTSIDHIIERTQVTKGAFYYHFASKDEMGLAMIDEVMYPGMQRALIQPLLHSTNPVADIYSMMKAVLGDHKHFQVKFGCPAINLIEEMAPINPAFHGSLQKLTIEWQRAIEKSIAQGKLNGYIKQDVNARQVSHFIIAGYGGIRNIGKILGPSSYVHYLKELKNYLRQLN